MIFMKKSQMFRKIFQAALAALLLLLPGSMGTWAANNQDAQHSFFLAKDKKISAQITDMRVTEDGSMEWDVLFENKSKEDLSARIKDVYLNDFHNWTELDLSNLDWVRLPARSSQEITMVCEAEILQIMELTQLDSFSGSVFYSIGYDVKVDLPFSFEAKDEPFLLFEDAWNVEAKPAENAPVCSLKLGNATVDLYYKGTRDDYGFYLLYDIKNEEDQQVLMKWNGDVYNDLDNGDVSILYRPVDGGTQSRMLHLAKAGKDRTTDEIYKISGTLSLTYETETETVEADVDIYPQGEEAWEQYSRQEQEPEGPVLLDDENMTVSVAAGDMFNKVYAKNKLDEELVLLITFLEQDGESPGPDATVLKVGPGMQKEDGLSYSIIMAKDGMMIGKSETALRMKLGVYPGDAYDALKDGTADDARPEPLSETEACVYFNVDGTVQQMPLGEYAIRYPSVSDSGEYLPVFRQSWTDLLSEDNLEYLQLSGEWMDVEDYFSLMVPDTMADCTEDLKPSIGDDLKLALCTADKKQIAMVIITSIPESWYQDGQLDLYALAGDNEKNNLRAVMAGENPALLGEGDNDKDGENDTLYLMVPDEDTGMICQFVLRPNDNPAYLEEFQMLLNSFRLK